MNGLMKSLFAGLMQWAMNGNLISKGLCDTKHEGTDKRLGDIAKLQSETRKDVKLILSHFKIREVD